MEIQPMLAETVADPSLVDWGNWIAEPKLDGVRCIAYLDSRTRLQSRSGSDLTRKFPELQAIHRSVNKSCILDGEIVCASFLNIQRRVHKERAMDIRIASKIYPARYEVFDILWLDGESLANKTLMLRKAVLEETVDFDLGIRPVLYYLDGIFLFNLVKEEGLEGIVGKRMASRYQGKRSPDWVKIKNFEEDTFVVCGLTQGENGRDKTFGSLVLGKQVNGDLRYVGNVGSGFTEETLKSLLKTFEAMRGDCPFRETPELDRELLFWTKPTVKVECRYLYGGDREAKLRFPTFRKVVK